MNFFKKLFKKSEQVEPVTSKKKFDINIILSQENINAGIIELDDYIGALCAWGEDIDKLSGPQRNFYFNQNLEREINNGGFNQYFFNSSGDFTHETIQALTAIRALKTVHLLQSAIDQFPDGKVPVDRTERQNLMEQIQDIANPIWEDIDKVFFLYQDDLNSLNMTYVSENKDEF
jgi:hypothetical protein